MSAVQFCPAPPSNQAGFSDPAEQLIFVPANAGLTFNAGPGKVPLDQVRALDESRIIARRGSLTAGEYQPILAGLEGLLGGPASARGRWSKPPRIATALLGDPPETGSSGARQLGSSGSISGRPHRIHLFGLHGITVRLGGAKSSSHNMISNQVEVQVIANRREAV